MFKLLRFISKHPLTRDAKWSALGRAVLWQVRSRTRGEIVIPWIEGTRFAARRSMTGATGNIYVGLHEFVDMMTLLHFLRPGDLFVDAGANVGSYTLLASGVCRAHTAAFEPDPSTSIHLQRNVSLNGLERLVTIHETALGSASGEVEFTVGRDCTNQVAPFRTSDTQLVKMERLDDVLASANPRMIKMDLEGHEENAILGARELLGCQSLKVLQAETVSDLAEDLLATHGFIKAYYDPFSRELGSTPRAYETSNDLFIRDEAMVRERFRSSRRIRVLDRLI